MAPSEGHSAFERAVRRMCPARVIPTACVKEPADGTTIAMHPWSPLNGRQLALLTRIGGGTDPVTSDNPELAHTARALKERHLITMPKQSGKWQAEITDAGRFYLEHGHHPDRPEPVPRKQRSAGSEQRTRTVQRRGKPQPRPRRSQRRSASRNPHGCHRRKSERL